MGKAKRNTKLIDRHPWAVMQPTRKCENCLRTFKWTPAMARLCRECGK